MMCYTAATMTSINTKQRYQNEHIPTFSSKHAKIARLIFYDRTFSTLTTAILNEKLFCSLYITLCNILLIKTKTKEHSTQLDLYVSKHTELKCPVRMLNGC